MRTRCRLASSNGYSSARNASSASDSSVWVVRMRMLSTASSRVPSQNARWMNSRQAGAGFCALSRSGASASCDAICENVYQRIRGLASR